MRMYISKPWATQSLQIVSEVFLSETCSALARGGRQPANRISGSLLIFLSNRSRLPRPSPTDLTFLSESIESIESRSLPPTLSSLLPLVIVP